MYLLNSKDKVVSAVLTKLFEMDTVGVLNSFQFFIVL